MQDQRPTAPALGTQAAGGPSASTATAATVFDRTMPEPGVRRFGRFNWLGLRTLSEREVRRFLKVSMQTVFAPALMAVLFLVVFTFAIARFRGDVAGLSYVDFLAPGLVMMTVLQNAFGNTSSSLMIAKIQGNIVDVLLPPLSPGELTVGLIVGGVARGIAVAFVTAVAMALLPFVHMSVHDPLALIFFLVGASALLALLGIMAGLWAEKFDHLATVTNFLVTPLAFLSGTFYQVEHLPPVFQAISHANPFFYLIDGFRYGMTGHAESNLWIGVAMTLALNLVLFRLCWLMLKTGYRIKA